MEHVGIDLHKSQSQICILTSQGELVEKRIRTTRDRFAQVFGRRSRCRILIEAATESEWVARCLEGVGHEVIVADPNYAPMYAQRSRRIKTDRRDARALAEACRVGSYRPAHRVSDEQHHVRARMAVRDVLVRTRARYLSLIRALLRRQGLRVRSGMAKTFVQRLSEIDLPDLLQAEIAPLLDLMKMLNEQIRRVEEELSRLVTVNPVVQRLMTTPEVGALTAGCFVATLDEVGRFRGPHQVEAYLGLVPRELSSAERQHKGRITKAGSPRMRWLLVQAAWRLLLRQHPETVPLKEWALRIALRRGKRVAVVALARRLAGILYAMWRDGTDYDPARLARVGRRVRMAV